MDNIRFRQTRPATHQPRTPGMVDGIGQTPRVSKRRFMNHEATTAPLLPTGKSRAAAPTLSAPAKSDTAIPDQPQVTQLPPVWAQKTVSGTVTESSGHSTPVEASPTEQAPQAKGKFRLSMVLPEADASKHIGKPLVSHKHWHAIRQWSLRSAILIVLLIFTTGGVLFAQGLGNAHKVFKGNAKSAAALQANVSPSLLKGEGDGRINVLLLGRGGDGHKAPDLTDTIMLASIDPVNKTASLLSIPRDLWVSIPKYGNMKINAAFASGKYKYLGKLDTRNNNPLAVQAGLALVDQAVSQVVGVPIHYNTLVDFKAFRQAVDTVGGVTVVVPTDLYDPTMAWENKRNPVLAKAGIQDFNGKKALMYVRSRETSSDFARGNRQRDVLVALKSKVTSLGTLSNPLKISGLLNSFGDNVETDLSLGDASRLYSLVKGINAGQIRSVDLATPPNSFVTTGNMNGQSIVQPRAGLFDYVAIQNYVRNQIKDGYLEYENAKITLLNGTRVEGAATTKANELKGYGYNVTTVANAPTSGYTKTIVVDLTHGKDKYTKNYLERRYNVTATTNMPDPAIQVAGADFIVIIGSDEATTR